MSTKNYYDGIAKGYKNLYHNEQIQKINLIKDQLPEKGLILDLGAGDGVLNQFIDKQVKLISLDLSINLLKLNKNKTKVNASATSLPFKDHTFDCIISMTVIQDIEQTKETIKEIKRVLKPNAKLIISFLKISKKAQNITQQLEQNFKIEKTIEEEKDIIIIAKNE